MKLLVIDDERPSRSELCHLIQQIQSDAIITQADSGYAALELAADRDFDAMFVDIHLGDINGVKLSAMLKKLQPDTSIIFATAFDKYALKAFDLEALDYVMKPFDPKRIEQTIAKINQKRQNGKSNSSDLKPDQPNMSDKMSVTQDKHVVLLDIKDIAYIETVDGNCIIHSKQKQYTSTQPLSYFEKRLASFRFFRIHKSYLINLNDIIEFFQWNIGTYCVKLRNYEHENLPISRKQIKLLRDVFDI